MSSLVHPPLAGVLRSARAEFNARFAEMKRRHPDLDADAFGAVLRTMVDPLALAVHSFHPDRVAAAVWAAYDAALVLVAEKLAGPGARDPLIGEGWQKLLPALAPLLAESPGRVIAAVTNALCQMASTPGVRAGEWGERLLRVAPELKSVELLLRAGELAARLCGVALYREGALLAADTLPPEVALQLFEAPADAAWSEVRARLLNDRWWYPARATKTEALPIVATVGAFRGFGGLFVAPPIVASMQGQIFVRSGDFCWLLCADVFGATFHRAQIAEFEAADREKSPVRILGSSVIYEGQTRDLPMLGIVSSAAATLDTLAVTGTLTHSITLLALS